MDEQWNIYHNENFVGNVRAFNEEAALTAASEALNIAREELSVALRIFFM